MSNDTREDLIARLVVIMGTVPGITSSVRNRNLRSNEQRPAMVLLDGDETPRVSLRGQRGRAAMMAPQIMELRPEVYILLQEGRPNNETVGQQLDAFRIVFLKKVWEDTILSTLLGSNGSIVYNGCQTDLKSGSSMSGEMRLDFVMNYVLKPTTP